MCARQGFRWCVIAALFVCSGRASAAPQGDPRQHGRIEQLLRQEGEAVIALADAVAAGRLPASDFSLDWHHDFLKAQVGTFMPFVVTVSDAELSVPAVLLYVRLVQRPQGGGEQELPPSGPTPPATASRAVVEEVFPVDLPPGAGPAHISRGLSAAPGEYDVIVVVREREREAATRGRRRAATLRRRLSVPDLTGPGLTTSTVMLAERLSPLPRPPDPDALFERPYVVGGQEVQLRLGGVFRRSDELVVVVLLYHPTLTAEKHFDLEVEYHFFRQDSPQDAGGDRVRSMRGLSAARPEETYFNRTEPQRFNPLVLGSDYEPSAGQPVLAGQRVSLAEFEAGEYRLAITVTDLVARRSIAREVYFTVLAR